MVQLPACGQIRALSRGWGNPALEPALLPRWRRSDCAQEGYLCLWQGDEKQGWRQISDSPEREPVCAALHTQPPPGEPRVLFLILRRCGCMTQLLGLGQLCSCGDPAPQKREERRCKRQAIGNWVFWIALEEAPPALPPRCPAVACLQCFACICLTVD